jgi:hypothetical protein
MGTVDRAQQIEFARGKILTAPANKRHGRDPGLTALDDRVELRSECVMTLLVCFEGGSQWGIDAGASVKDVQALLGHKGSGCRDGGSAFNEPGAYGPQCHRDSRLVGLSKSSFVPLNPRFARCSGCFRRSGPCRQRQRSLNSRKTPGIGFISASETRCASRSQPCPSPA